MAADAALLYESGKPIARAFTAADLAVLLPDGGITADKISASSSSVLIAVYNDTGGPLTAPCLVHISGWNEPTSGFKVVKADADAGIEADAILLTTLANGHAGTAYLRGRTTGLNIAGAVGTAIYLSSTAGGYTTSAPSGPDQIAQEVGSIAVAQSAPGAADAEIEWHVESEFSAIGSTQLQAASVTVAKLATDAVETAKIKGANVTDDKLASKLVKEIGGAGIGHIRLTAGSAAAQKLTIDGEDYASPGGTANAGACAVELLGLVNAGAKAYAYTDNIAGDAQATLSFVRRTAAAASVVISTDIAGAVVSAATTVEGQDAAVREEHAGSHVVTANEVTALGLGTNPWVPIASFPSTTAPRSCVLRVRTAAFVEKAINALVSWKLVQGGAGFYMLLIKDTGAVLAATDLIDFVIV